MSDLLSHEAKQELERLVNRIAERSARLFDEQGELEPAVFAILVTPAGSSDVSLLEGASRFFSGSQGKNALSMVIEHLLNSAPPGAAPAALVVTESWANFGVSAAEVEASGGSPSERADRQECIALNLVLPGGVTFLHFLLVDPSSRKTIAAAPFTIDADPGYEARSRFARRPTQH